MYILLLCWMFYVCQVVWVLFKTSVSLLISCLLVLLITRGSGFNLTVIFNLSISSSFIHFYFVKFNALLFGTCTYKIVMSSWWINPFIIILSPVIFLVLSILYLTLIQPIPISFWILFAWFVFFLIFTFNLSISLYLGVFHAESIQLIF